MKSITRFNQSSASSMHGAIVPIAYASSSVTSGQTGIIISNIPQGYQDLRIIFYGFISNSSNYFNLRLNNAVSGYSHTQLWGNGSTASSARATSENGLHLASTYALPSNSSAPVIFTIDILNYTNSSTYKSLLWREAFDQNGSGETLISAGLWQSTSAINQISLGTDAGGATYLAGTTVEVFGIRTVGQ